MLKWPYSLPSSPVSDASHKHEYDTNLRIATKHLFQSFSGISCYTGVLSISLKPNSPRRHPLTKKKPLPNHSIIHDLIHISKTIIRGPHLLFSYIYFASSSSSSSLLFPIFLHGNPLLSFFCNFLLPSSPR